MDLSEAQKRAEVDRLSVDIRKLKKQLELKKRRLKELQPVEKKPDDKT